MEQKNPIKKKSCEKNTITAHRGALDTIRSPILPPSRQKEIADELLAYVKLPNKFTIIGFMAEQNLSRAVWHDWCQRYPIIHAAHERAKIFLGAKRFDTAASKNGSDKLLQWAGQYDVDALAFMKLIEEMKAEEEEESDRRRT